MCVPQWTCQSDNHRIALVGQLSPVWIRKTDGELPHHLHQRFFGLYGRQWMHNGEIAEFAKIRRKLQATLSDEIFDSVKGNTGRRL